MGHTITRFGDAYGLLGLASVGDASDIGVINGAIAKLMQSHHGSHFQYLDTVMHTWPTRDGILAARTAALSLLILHEAGAPIYYVSPDTFAGHALCDAQPSWINGAQITFDTKRPSAKSESYHPTVTGQQQGYGEAFRRVIARNMP